jgi:hypothetical protein
VALRFVILRIYNSGFQVILVDSRDNFGCPFRIILVEGSEDIPQGSLFDCNLTQKKLFFHILVVSALARICGCWTSSSISIFSTRGTAAAGSLPLGQTISGPLFTSLEHPSTLLCEAEIVFEKHAFGYAAREIEVSHRRYTGDSWGLPLQEHT